MNDKLNNKLIEILSELQNGVNKGIDFAVEQLPDAVTQLLHWYCIYYFVLCVIGVLLLGTFYYSSYKWITVIEPKIDTSFRWVSSVIGVGIGGFALHIGVFTKLFNLQWLKILVAPKIWLVEYATTLVK